jgi:tRNA (cytidine/uridine-2'-O-)-methyltransferase
MFNFNVVLFEPEIPQNTGNVIRTCAAVGAKLHLIKPLGFFVDDKHLKRAGLGYWNEVDITFYKNFSAFYSKYEQEKLTFITKKAAQIYNKIDYSGNIFLIFGKETAGIPEEILVEHRSKCFRIPMRAGVRSLNLSNAVAVISYEAYRQNGFPSLELSGGMDSSKNSE